MRVDVFCPFLFLYKVFHEEVMNEETIPLISEQHNASDSGTPSIQSCGPFLPALQKRHYFKLDYTGTYQLKLKSPARLFYAGKAAVKCNLHQMDKVLRISQNRGRYMLIILSVLLREKLQQTVHKNHCLITAVLSQPYNPALIMLNNTCSGTPLSIVQ